MTDPIKQDRHYSLLDEEEFVLKLGCWKEPNAERFLPERTDQEYISRLKKYLQVNNDRTDRLGIHGCGVALRELRRLSK